MFLRLTQFSIFFQIIDNLFFFVTLYRMCSRKFLFSVLTGFFPCIAMASFNGDFVCGGKVICRFYLLTFIILASPWVENPLLAAIIWSIGLIAVGFWIRWVKLWSKRRPFGKLQSVGVAVGGGIVIVAITAVVAYYGGIL